MMIAAAMRLNEQTTIPSSFLFGRHKQGKGQHLTQALSILYKTAVKPSIENAVGENVNASFQRSTLNVLGVYERLKSLVGAETIAAAIHGLDAVGFRTKLFAQKVYALVEGARGAHVGYAPQRV